jgi:hypothetical protein
MTKDEAPAADATRGGQREGAGRPPVENPRNVVFQLRMTKDERDKLDRLALVASMGLDHKSEITPAEWLRALVAVSPEPHPSTLRAAIAEAKRRELEREAAKKKKAKA